MIETFSLAEVDGIVAKIRKQIKQTPKAGLILGSGLGPLAEAVENPVKIPYSQLAPWPISTVPGHVGQLVFGELEGQYVMVMQGRIHFYEGYNMHQVTLPVRVMQRLGIPTLIVTNAAGGVNKEFEAGDLMLITDHINLIGMAGMTPLRGPNIDEFGPRFPDMSQAYNRTLLVLARKVAQQNNVPLREGIYICLSGPSFETPADLRFLSMIGVDAVGMSTVPEVTVANHGGMHVLGISGITNKCSTDGNAVTTHEEVLEAGRKMAPKLIALLRGVLKEI